MLPWRQVALTFIIRRTPRYELPILWKNTEQNQQISEQHPIITAKKDR